MDNRFILLLILLFTFLTDSAQNALPIHTARTISFETTEGTYMDVDLSPDGKTIVFDLLGDLYTLPVVGGSAKQLTRGLAYNRLPIWSPDGKQIAFISDASGAVHVNVIDSDGVGLRTLGTSEAQIAFGDVYAEPMPAWTPDGNYIAFNGRLYHLAGGNMSLPLQIKLAVQYSSDGNFLYFEENGFTERGLLRNDLHTGAVTKITTLPQFHTNIRVSPDGHWLAYIKDSESESSLLVRDLLTGEDRLLVPSIEGHRRVFKERYIFTHDSHNVLIGFGGKLHRIDIHDGSDRVIPFSAQVHVDLGPFNYNTYRIMHDSLTVHYTRSANASPDGRHLVFSALNRLYEMDLPNGIPYSLVDQPIGQFQPVYSPDGKWIAYVTWSDTAGGQLWRVAALGGSPQQISHTANIYQHPTWSPDGRWIAVLTADKKYAKDSYKLDRFYGDFFCDIQLFSISENIITKVTDSVPSINSLAFTPDGLRLIFTPRLNEKKSGDSTYPRLVSSALDGTDKHVLAAAAFNELINTGYPSGIKQVSLSPDGHYIVYEILEDLYLVPLAGLGKPPILNSRSGTFPIIRFAQGGMDPHWERDGKVLSWSYGNQFYRVDPSEIVSAAIQAAKDSAKEGKMGKFDDGFFTIDNIPAEVITMRVIVPRYYAHGTIAMRDVRIVSMKGNEVITHGVIVITDGKFTAVGAMDTVKIPRNAKILNLSGKTIIPGLIDMHDHMHTSADIFEQQAWRYLANLAYGVTTGRDPSSNFDSFGYGELLESGQMTGPRLFTVGNPVLINFERLNSLEDARAIVRKRAILGAITVKQYLQPTRLQKQWLLMACREAGINMTNEGEGEDVWSDLAMIKDGSSGIEHEPAWGNVYNDVISFVAKSRTWHTPTLQVQYPGGARGLFYFFNLFFLNPDIKLSRFWPDDDIHRLMEPRKAPVDSAHPNFVYVSSIEAAIRHHGGNVTMGSHGNWEGIGAHWEIQALQMGGLTNLEALQAATIEAAAGLGMQQDLGSIEPGKFADLIVLDKNPLDNIQNTLSIKYVMKDGELFDGNTLDALWPQYKKAPEWRLHPAATPFK